MGLGFLTRNLRYKLLALASAAMLWGVAHGTADIEQGFDIPVVFSGLPDSVVIVDQNSDVVNVRMRGSRAGLRRMTTDRPEYMVDVSGARSGRANYEVDLARLEFPRGTRPVSRSPSSLIVEFEPRASRVVRVKPELAGRPAEGYTVAGIDLTPSEVRIEGARSEVRQRGELATEAIDVTGLSETVTREVRVALTRPNVWLAGDPVLEARIRVKPVDEAP